MDMHTVMQHSQWTGQKYDTFHCSNSINMILEHYIMTT